MISYLPNESATKISLINILERYCSLHVLNF